MSVPEIDREDFRLWLAAKEPDDKVSGGGLECPVAAFLRWSEGRDYSPLSMGGLWRVSRRSFGPMLAEDGPLSWRSPAWVGAFIDRVDWAGSPDWDDLTAKEALTILDSIEVAP